MTGEVRPRERNIRASIQRIGGSLAGMVMPNIGAFIAWGLITALFVPDGWLPNARIAEIVEPMINVLLPVLIGYTGGRMVHGPRGAVVGAVATMGIVVGAGIPMFLGAMVIGPFAALLVKLFDNSVGDRVPPGFKMLVDNFSAGIIGGAVAILGMLAIGPAVEVATTTLGDGVRATRSTTEYSRRSGSPTRPRTARRSTFCSRRIRAPGSGFSWPAWCSASRRCGRRPRPRS
jgi:mannitol PTS system EIICBA or EIICB component